MQIRAFIFLVCTVVYFFETIRLPVSLLTQAQNTGQTCCHQMTGKSHPGCGGSKSQDQGTRNQDEKNCVACCDSCPLCYVAVIADPPEETSCPYAGKMQYSSFCCILVTGICNEPWAPPDIS